LRPKLIYKIYSRSEELDNANAATSGAANAVGSVYDAEGSVEKFVDVTGHLELKVSSRSAMIGSLNDNSTETFWESGDEDRNKAKWVTAQLLPQHRSPGQHFSLVAKYGTTSLCTYIHTYIHTYIQKYIRCVVENQNKNILLFWSNEEAIFHSLKIANQPRKL
jgi:hypothetical protein